MRQGGASRSAFPRRPGAFHWSSAELKGPFFLLFDPKWWQSIPGFAVEVLLNYDLGGGYAPNPGAHPSVNFQQNALPQPMDHASAGERERVAY